MKDKWYYIGLISKASNRYGDKLLELMEQFNRYNLKEVTLDEAKTYYDKMVMQSAVM